jgi:hypothetical protein
MVTFSCKSCDHTQALTEFFAGKLVSCPKCGEVNFVQVTDRVYDLSGVPQMAPSGPVPLLPDIADVEPSQSHASNPVAQEPDYPEREWAEPAAAQIAYPPPRQSRQWGNFDTPDNNEPYYGDPRAIRPAANQPSRGWPEGLGAEPPMPEVNPINGPFGHSGNDSEPHLFEQQERLGVGPVLAFATALVFWVLPIKEWSFTTGLVGMLVLSFWMLIRTRRGLPVTMLIAAFVFTSMATYRSWTSPVYNPPRAMEVKPMVHGEAIGSYSFNTRPGVRAVTTFDRTSSTGPLQSWQFDPSYDASLAALVGTYVGKVKDATLMVGSSRQPMLPPSHSDLMDRIGQKFDSRGDFFGSGWMVTYSPDVANRFNLRFNGPRGESGAVQVTIDEASYSYRWSWRSDDYFKLPALLDELPPPSGEDF